MKFFELIPSGTNIDFIGKLKLFLVLSAITVGISLAGLFTKGLNYGIDFTGGSVLQVKFPQKTTAEEARRLTADFGAPEATVVAVGSDGFEYLITSRASTDVKAKSQLQNKFEEKFGAGVILSAEMVGPKVGKELKWSAGQALFYSVVLIMIYIWFRFDIRFAPGATIAMIHDIILATGYYVFTQNEFTITGSAALLTIAGYSVNDTIVIYDRVREMLKHGGDAMPLSQTINRAINLTLSRTLLTSIITFISIIPIVVYCDGEIRDFAEAMMVGIFVGSYSTIYIAAPMTIYIEKFLAKKKAPVGGGRPAPAVR